MRFLQDNNPTKCWFCAGKGTIENVWFEVGRLHDGVNLGFPQLVLHGNDLFVSSVAFWFSGLVSVLGVHVTFAPCGSPFCVGGMLHPSSFPSIFLGVGYFDEEDGGLWINDGGIDFENDNPHDVPEVDEDEGEVPV